MNIHHIIIFLLILLISFMSIILINNTYAEFNSGFESQTFGGDSNDFGEEISFPQEPKRPFFIHDTFIKFLFLLGFTITAILIFLKKRSFRKILLILSIIIPGFYLGGFLCPLASVQNIVLNYRTGYLLLFLIPTLLAFIFGRLFCGYICIFGAVQEFIKSPIKYHLTFSARTQKTLQKMKYIILIYLIVRILVTNSLILAGSTPFNAVFSFGGTSLSIILTIITILLSLVIYRPFCQFFCPLGAWLGLCAILNKYNIIPDDCISCKKCTNLCNIKAINRGKINKKECILCAKCIDSCPKS